MVGGSPNPQHPTFGIAKGGDIAEQGFYIPQVQIPDIVARCLRPVGARGWVLYPLCSITVLDTATATDDTMCFHSILPTIK